MLEVPILSMSSAPPERGKLVRVFRTRGVDLNDFCLGASSRQDIRDMASQPYTVRGIEPGNVSSHVPALTLELVCNVPNLSVVGILCRFR